MYICHCQPDIHTCFLSNFFIFFCINFRGDEFPQNILKATEDLKTVNIIPAIGKQFDHTESCNVKAPLTKHKGMKHLHQSSFMIFIQMHIVSFCFSGLNVHSMLKHESLVLTLEAVKFLEKKLLWHDVRYAPLHPFKLPYSDLP